MKMVIGGYTLDLYCDCNECGKVTLHIEYRHQGNGFRSFVGQTNAECMRQAMSAGWFFFNNKTKCFAPGHKVG